MLKSYFKPVAYSVEETESNDVLKLEAARFGSWLYVGSWVKGGENNTKVSKLGDR